MKAQCILPFLTPFLFIQPVHADDLSWVCQETDNVLLNDSCARLKATIRAADEEKKKRELAQEAARNKPAIAYFNEATNEMFVGNRNFQKDDHAAAKQTWGSYNTKKPEGPGWIALPESSYTSYMAVVNGHKEPRQSGSEAIYRNCVIEKSANQPESVMREIRATCRAISSDPSIFERWKWGE